MTTATSTIKRLKDFDDPALTPETWSNVLAASDTDSVFMTWHWQRAWWDTFARGNLVLLVSERDDRAFCIAPLFADAGMIFFVGSGGSDYLDFVGDVSDPDVLCELLDAAMEAVPDFLGFRFYHVPDSSRTSMGLKIAARRLDLVCCEEGSLAAPVLSLTDDEAARAATEKKSLRRHERWFRREGTLKVNHARTSAVIRPQLPSFFEQHIRRWDVTDFPSLFNDPTQQSLYRRLTDVAGEAGWLRFTQIVWNGDPVAYHFGFCYKGNFMWYKPSFSIDLAKHSPGEVLLRQLLLTAMEEEAHTFDFGLGDEPFKRRFATQVNTVTTWGLYPSSTLNSR